MDRPQVLGGKVIERQKNNIEMNHADEISEWSKSTVFFLSGNFGFADRLIVVKKRSKLTKSDETGKTIDFKNVYARLVSVTHFFFIL